MFEDYILRTTPDIAADTAKLTRLISRQERIALERFKGIKIIKRSIDARQKNIAVNLTVRCFLDEVPKSMALYEPYQYGDVSNASSVVVVGAGPAGLFAALRLIELGLRPIVVERGKPVDERKFDLAQISRTGNVDVNSNYSFGEGGAGAYSDGKLYTRSKKRGEVNRILQIFNQFGASDDILVDAHPHIGSDKLPKIIKSMREQIIKSGGEVHFSTLFDKFIYWDGLLNKAIDAETLVGEDVSKKIIEKAKNAVRIIFEAANSDSHHFVSSSLLQACLLKKQDIFIWMKSQEIINERVERFLLYNIEPNDYDLKSNSSSVWKAFLNQDNENKNIDFYIYLYILAHNWHDVIAIEMLKHSFYHIYIALSKNQLDEKKWNRISCFTSISYFIDKWDKCKILSRGLVDYLKNTSVDIRVLKEFTPNKKINERLVHYWKKG